MIEVVFLACSIVIGPVCEEKRLVFMEEPGTLTAFSCARYGQMELAKWRAQNTNWCIPKGYKCRPAGQFAKA